MLLVDVVLAVAGIAMLISYMDERERTVAGTAPTAALPSQGASSDGTPAWPAAQDGTSGGASAAGPGASAGTKPTTEVMDQLTRHVGVVVERQNEQLQRCYTQASRQTTGSAPLAGRLDLRFELTSAGRARRVRVDSNTIGSSELAQCVIALFESWTFPPPPGNEPVELEWPLRFKAPK